MLKGDTDEIRMKINSCFVKKHECWERRGKNWIARITGLDKKYGYKREFLETVKVGTEKVFRLEDFQIGDIYEVASIKGGVTKKINVKDAFECVEITETHVVLRYLTQEEVIQKLGEERTAGFKESHGPRIILWLYMISKYLATVFLEAEI